jgi:hypothetical protein
VVVVVVVVLLLHPKIAFLQVEWSTTDTGAPYACPPKNGQARLNFIFHGNTKHPRFEVVQNA